MFDIDRVRDLSEMEEEWARDRLTEILEEVVSGARARPDWPEDKYLCRGFAMGYDHISFKRGDTVEFSCQKQWSGRNKHTATRAI